MKISDRNTVLHLLTGNGEVSVTVNETDTGIRDSIYLFFNHEFVDLRQTFTRKIQYICKPFLDAFNQAGEKKVMPSLSSAQLT